LTTGESVELLLIVISFPRVSGTNVTFARLTMMLRSTGSSSTRTRKRIAVLSFWLSVPPWVAVAPVPRLKTVT
jgi:hypothetical protein